MSMDFEGMFSQMCKLRDFRSKRSSSWNRSGGNYDWIKVPPGKSHVLLDEGGAGCVKHFYWTYVRTDEHDRLNTFRGVVLRAFWDGASKPSIEVPLGDFFGVSNGVPRSIRSLAFVANAGKNGSHLSWGLNCYLPMPFACGGLIEIENQGDADAQIWYHIDYELYDAPTALPAGTGRLHAQWRREPSTKAVPLPKGKEEIKNLTGDENYVILDVAGNGQFAGYFLTVVNRHRTWWGEGDDMIFIDGEKFPPSLHGTGTEEIFGGGACPAIEYTGPYTGFHCIENRAGYNFWGTNGMYRFHMTDPIRFRKSIRVTLEHGHGNDMANDYCSTAFWYQDRPNRKLPKLPPLSKRRVNLMG